MGGSDQASEQRAGMQAEGYVQVPYSWASPARCAGDNGEDSVEV